MKLIVATILALVFIFPAQAQTEQITLNIAKPSQAYPPYHWKDEEQVTGLVPDIINEIANNIGNIKINYVIMPWKRMFELAKAGKIDAIMPISKNPQRESYLNFINEPLILEKMSFVSSTAFDITFDGDINKLSKFEVAGIAGYYYGEAYEAANFTTIELPNEETQIRMLLAGRFPLALLDMNIIPHYVNKLGGEKPYAIKLLKPHLYEAGLHLAFSKSSKHAGLAQKFSLTLQQLKQTDKYQKILQKYLTNE